MIKEQISYVIPIAFDDSKSGTPILIYEMSPDKTTVDLSFGVFFIGLKSEKKYSVGFEVFNDAETPIPINSKEFINHNFFTVAESLDGERIVSASLRQSFKGVTIKKSGIFEVRASLVDTEKKVILDKKSAFFDVKPKGAWRDEFR